MYRFPYPKGRDLIANIRKINCICSLPAKLPAGATANLGHGLSVVAHLTDFGSGCK